MFLLKNDQSSQDQTKDKLRHLPKTFPAQENGPRERRPAGRPARLQDAVGELRPQVHRWVAVGRLQQVAGVQDGLVLHDGDLVEQAGGRACQPGQVPCDRLEGLGELGSDPARGGHTQVEDQGGGQGGEALPQADLGQLQCGQAGQPDPQAAGHLGNMIT